MLNVNNFDAQMLVDKNLMCKKLYMHKKYVFLNM